MGTDTDGTSVVCARLAKVIVDASHLGVIEDVVKRVHRITIDGTELLALHLARCLENDLPVPNVDANFFKMAFMEVSQGRGTRTRVDAELETTRTSWMPSLVPVSRSKLDQVLMSQAIAFAATYKTNLW